MLSSTSAPAEALSSADKVREWFEHFWSMSDPYDLAELYGRFGSRTRRGRSTCACSGSCTASTSMPTRIPNARTGLNLTRFQADGVARMERLLDEHGGVLVADEVGLGKTFLAGEVIYRTANLNRQRVLIVAPAALKTSMWEPFLVTLRLQPLGEGLLLRGSAQSTRPREGPDRRLPAGDRGLLARRHRRGTQPSQLRRPAIRCGRPGDHRRQPEEESCC